MLIGFCGFSLHRFTIHLRNTFKFLIQWVEEFSHPNLVKYKSVSDNCIETSNESIAEDTGVKADKYSAIIEASILYIVLLRTFLKPATDEEDSDVINRLIMLSICFVAGFLFPNTKPIYLYR